MLTVYFHRKKNNRILYDVDHWGNSVLHALVARSMTNMYKFIVNFEENFHKKHHNSEEELEVHRSALDLTIDEDDDKPKKDIERQSVFLVDGKELAEAKAFKKRALEETEQKKKHIKHGLRLESLANKQGYVPLSFAVYIDNREMFKFILELKKTVIWQFGPVSCCTYPLEHLDVFASPLKSDDQLPEMYCCVKNDKKMVIRQKMRTTEKFKALDVILRKQRFEMLLDNTVEHLIQKKWALYGRRQFAYRCIVAAINYVCLCSAFLLEKPCCEQPWDNMRTEDVGFMISVFVATMIAAYKLFIEGAELISEGRSFFFGFEFSVICFDNACSGF